MFTINKYLNINIKKYTKIILRRLVELQNTFQQWDIGNNNHIPHILEGIIAKIDSMTLYNL